jgi:GT2 family glycosyltransferase
VRYLHIPERGATRAVNAAIAVASGEIIAMTDDDCQPRPDWLTLMGAIFAAEPEVGIVAGAVICPPKGQPGPGECPGQPQFEAIYTAEVTNGEGVYHVRAMPGHTGPPLSGITIGWPHLWISANVAFRRAALDRIGPFDPYLGPGARFPSFDDADISWRAMNLGITCRTSPRLIVEHTGGWRYGWRTVWHLRRGTVQGFGALTAKLTLSQDSRGAQLRHNEHRVCLQAFGRPYRLPRALLRLFWYETTYRRCLRDFTVSEHGVLQPRGTAE